MIAVQRLAEVFVEVADTLVGDFDVIEFLESLRRTAEVIDTAAAGLLLGDHARPAPVHGGLGQPDRLLELFQLQYQEGPCLDCFRSGGSGQHRPGPRGERWPLFAPRAVEAGFQSVHAIPMRPAGRSSAR